MGECVYFQIVRYECGYSYFGNCKYIKYIEYFVYLLNVYSARAGKFPSILIVSVIRNCLTLQNICRIRFPSFTPHTALASLQRNRPFRQRYYVVECSHITCYPTSSRVLLRFLSKAQYYENTFSFS